MQKILLTEVFLDGYKSRERDELSELSAPVRSPFIPEDEAERAEVCELALEIQARSLANRIERAYAKNVVIGVSGGLDSTLALLVAVRAMQITLRKEIILNMKMSVK